MSISVVLELHRNPTNWNKISPNHESLVGSFDGELRKNNFGVLYTQQADGEFENYKRQGHGQARLKTTIQKCKTRNIHWISLHMDLSRTLVMSLYIKHGFQVNNLIKSYYSSNKDAYRMHLDFNAN
ncbi:hypothetical protein AAG906_024793 [Vitis piasezkii]